MGSANPRTTLTPENFHGAYVELTNDVTASNFVPTGYGALTWPTIRYDTDNIFETVAKQAFVVPAGFKYAKCGCQIDTNADPVWAASTAYALDDIVQPTVGSMLRYQVTTAGTSGAAEPAWPTIMGGTVTDGTVTWTCIHAASIKPRIQWNAEGFGRGINDSALNGYPGTVHTTSNGNTGWLNVSAGDTFKVIPIVGANRKVTIAGAFTFFWIELRN